MLRHKCLRIGHGLSSCRHRPLNRIFDMLTDVSGSLVRIAGRDIDAGRQSSSV